MKKKKALFLTYDGLTDPLGQSQILPYLIGLSKEYEIYILSCEKEDALLKNKAVIQEMVDSNNIQWRYTNYSNNPPVVSTALGLWKMKKKAILWHKEAAFDIVHCRSVLTTWIGAALQARGAQYIFDIRGFWAEERVDGELWNLGNPLFAWIYRLFKNRQISQYREANHIITLSKAAKKFIEKDYSIPTEKLTVIPCTADYDHFQPSDRALEKKELLKKELNIPEDALVVSYLGSLGTRYLSNEMIDCFYQISKEHPHSIFLIVSKSDTNGMKNYAAQLGISDKMIFTSCEYPEVPAHILLADIGLYFIFAGNSGPAVSPTKQAEFLGLGVPVISNVGIGDVNEIEEEDLGLVAKSFDEEEYKRISSSIPKLLALPKADIINIAKRKFNLKDGIVNYQSVYRALT